jgi:hypothetical protein
MKQRTQFLPGQEPTISSAKCKAAYPAVGLYLQLSNIPTVGAYNKEVTAYFKIAIACSCFSLTEFCVDLNLVSVGVFGVLEVQDGKYSRANK